MTRYILDTDHLTLLKRNHPIVTARISSIHPENISVTIVTVEEQLRGRLAIVSTPVKVTTCTNDLNLKWSFQASARSSSLNENCQLIVLNRGLKLAVAQTLVNQG